MRTSRPASLASLLIALAGAPLAPLAWAQDTTETQAIAAASDLSAAFRYAAQTVRPSVVSIYSTRDEPTYVRDPFGRTFRGNDRESTGLGSGFFIDAQGYILTNNHVVEGADSLRVNTAWGQAVDAQVVATDPRTDLAVVKVNPKDFMRALAPATLGDSDELQVGDWVIAVGSPLGLEQTVTAGIVSAIGREEGILGDEGYEAFIQTDAAINPGNSGGPLVNLKGEIVGINSAIRTAGPVGGSIGLGFSIPMSIARDVAQQLIATGHVHRGYLGVAATALTPDAAVMLGLPAETQGVVVNRVEKDAPAADAGLARGDVITSINGKGINDFSDLKLAIATIRPGDNIELDVFRGTQKLRLVAAAIERPNSQVVDVGLGLSATDSGDRGDQLLKQFGVRGATVAQIQPQSPAASAGFRESDTILAVENLSVDSPQQLAELLARARPGQTLRFIVLNKDGAQEQKVLRIPRR